jgi:hypothetical protein
MAPRAGRVDAASPCSVRSPACKCRATRRGKGWVGKTHLRFCGYVVHGERPPKRHGLAAVYATQHRPQQTSCSPRVRVAVLQDHSTFCRPNPNAPMDVRADAYLSHPNPNPNPNSSAVHHSQPSPTLSPRRSASAHRTTHTRRWQCEGRGHTLQHVSLKVVTALGRGTYGGCVVGQGGQGLLRTLHRQVSCALSKPWRSPGSDTRRSTPLHGVHSTDTLECIAALRVRVCESWPSCARTQQAMDELSGELLRDLSTVSNPHQRAALVRPLPPPSASCGQQGEL